MAVPSKARGTFKTKKPRKEFILFWVLVLNGGGAGIRTRVHESLPRSIYMLISPFIFLRKLRGTGSFRKQSPYTPTARRHHSKSACNINSDNQTSAD